MRDNAELKKELVEKAKELAEKVEGTATYRDIADLRKKWKRASSEEESFLEKELSDKFEEYLAKIKGVANEISGNAEDRKKALIEEAKKIKETNNYKAASIKMNELMDSWKAAGRTVKEKDDELWAEFKEVRDEFYANKKAYFENLKEVYAKSKETKEEIIKKAVEANTKTSFKEIATIMDGLMEEWKKAGRASKDVDEKLWKEFNEQRQAFYKNRKAYFASMKETYASRAEQKNELIKEAKLYLARSEFTDDEINSVKELRTKWKEVGSAGKDNEDKLWNEFNEIVNKYYDNMRVYKK